MLATRLSQAFLLPGDSKAALAREERRSAFADLYRRLVLHQLNSRSGTRPRPCCLACAEGTRHLSRRRSAQLRATPRPDETPSSSPPCALLTGALLAR